MHCSQKPPFCWVLNTRWTSHPHQNLTDAAVTSVQHISESVFRRQGCTGTSAGAQQHPGTAPEPTLHHDHSGISRPDSICHNHRAKPSPMPCQDLGNTRSPCLQQWTGTDIDTPLQARPYSSFFTLVLSSASICPAVRPDFCQPATAKPCTRWQKADLLRCILQQEGDYHPHESSAYRLRLRKSTILQAFTL